MVRAAPPRRPPAPVPLRARPPRPLLTARRPTRPPGDPPPGSTPNPALTSRSTVEVTVPPAFGGGPFDSPRKLTVPTGWTVQVWAPIPDARMEAWTPEGDLLVSEPNYSRIVEVIPGSDSAKSWHTILSGLTLPQGLAFARAGGQWVLYVGESDQIDRYPWNAGGIAGPAHRHRCQPAGCGSARRRRPSGQGHRCGRQRDPLLRRWQLVERQPG